MTIKGFENEDIEVSEFGEWVGNDYIDYKSDYKEHQKIINELLKQKQELIDYLKNLLENRYTNSKVVWFDSGYAKIYGELCTMAGANDDRLPLVPLSEIENILSKIEKR